MGLKVTFLRMTFDSETLLTSATSFLGYGDRQFSKWQYDGDKITVGL